VSDRTLVTVRGFSPTELEDLAAARLLALEQMPYLATALFEVVPVCCPGLGTFAVDAAWRLYIDPAQLERWGPPAAAGVLLHEVGHLLRDHHARHAEQPHHDALLWNLAADAEINDDLVEAGVPLPDGPVTPACLDQPDGQLAERYYHHLLDRHRELIDPACGSGAGGAELDVELDDDDGHHPTVSPLDQELVRRKVAGDIEAAGEGRGAQPGAVPGGWQRWATQHLEPPVIAWPHRLRRAMRRSLSVQAGQLDTSYRRTGRRRVPGVVTPGMVQPELRVGVVVDTSSSMSDGQLGAALAELDGICRRAGIRDDGLTVVTADVEVREVPRLRHAADLPIIGGGGTDLRPAIRHLVDHRRRPVVVVVLTDGFTPWPSEPPTRCQVIAVVIARSDGLVPAEPPAWVQAIGLPRHRA
jgi:predicted metal-dependent peptidase